MKPFGKKIFMTLVVFLIMLAPLFSFAQITIKPCETPGTICNPIQETDVNSFIKTILEGAIKIAIPVIALAIIYSGFLFVTARGNPEGITKAKDALLYSLIGAAILLGAWALAQLVSETVLSL